MKHVIYDKYGDSSVLKVKTTNKPTLNKKNSLLVKVLYSSLNAIDWKNRKGHFKIVSGLFKPRTKQGFDVVGIVEGKSKDVKDFSLCDKIVVLLGNFEGGALSSYITISTKNAVKIPNDINLREVAGIPMAGTTAWMALLKNGKIKKGDNVLINGGSSGVGHFAIQIAKAYGAEVTSISSNKNLEFCKALGANNAISYQSENFLVSNKKYDIIFDVVLNTSFKKTKSLLTNNGVYIGTTPTIRMIKELLLNKQAKFVAVQPNKEALFDIIRLMQENKLVTKIDKEFTLDEIVKAHNYIEKSRTVGKVIIKVV